MRSRQSRGQSVSGGRAQRNAQNHDPLRTERLLPLLTVSSVVLIDDSGADVDRVLPCETRARGDTAVHARRQCDGEVSRAESLSASRNHDILRAREIVSGGVRAAADRENGRLREPARTTTRQRARGTGGDEVGQHRRKETIRMQYTSMSIATHFLTTSLMADMAVGRASACEV